MPSNGDPSAELEFQAVDGKLLFNGFGEPELTCELAFLVLVQFEKFSTDLPAA